MGAIWTICRNELRSNFLSPIAYVYMVVFFVFVKWYFFRNFFVVSQADMRIFFEVIPWIFLFLIPAISMRVWSEEKKLGTLDFLFTLPIHDYELVLGKYLASLFMLWLVILGTMPLFLVVFLLGEPDIGSILTGYFGLFFLGASFLSVGFLMSSITKNQIIAFVLSLLVCFFTYIFSEALVLNALPDFLVPIVQKMSVGMYYDYMAKGIIDIRSITYYTSFISFFLYSNMTVFSLRRLR